MTVLTLEGVQKAYGDRRVLEDVSLSLGPGDRLGLLGVNGAGKSTLLRIMAGLEEPDSGKVARRRDLVVGFLEQEPVLDPALDVQGVLEQALVTRHRLLDRLEEIDASLASASQPRPATGTERLLEERAGVEDALERAGGWEVGHRLQRMSEALRLPPGATSVAVLSGGERRRLALARLLLEGPRLLLLDEPTNHLDTRTIDWLEQLLASWDGAMVLVTHDRYFLERVVTGIVEIDRSRLYRYHGRYRDYLEQRAARLEAEGRGEVARAGTLRRELEWIRRGPQARTHKQKARQQRYEALVEAAPEAAPQAMALLIPDGPRTGKQIVDLLGVGKGYGERVLIRELTLRTRPGDRIGVVGENGAGKTTLLRLLLGEEAPDRGQVVLGARTKLVHASQDRLELDPERTVYEAVAENTEHVWLGGEQVHVRSYLTRFLFPHALQETKVGRLSGGERNRLQLARLLRDGGNVLLLDEPTNDLDLMTLRVLEEALVAFPGVVFVVSHDRYLLNRVATAILAFEEGGEVVLYEGDYDFYAARREERLAAARAAAAGAPHLPRAVATAPRRAQLAPAPRKRLTIPEQRELQGLEQTILEAEQEVKARTAELEDPELYRLRAREVPELVAGLQAAQRRVETLFARWGELEERRG